MPIEHLTRGSLLKCTLFNYSQLQFIITTYHWQWGSAEGWNLVGSRVGKSDYVCDFKHNYTQNTPCWP